MSTIEKSKIHKGRTSEFNPDLVREVSVEVYKALLETDNGDGAVKRMLAKDKDKGEKLEGRAAAYDRLSRCYLKVLTNMGKLK